MTMQKQQPCGDDDNKKTALASFKSNTGRGPGGNGRGYVVAPSNTGWRREQQEVGAGGCGMGFSVDLFACVP